MCSLIVTRLLSMAILCKVMFKLIPLALWCMLKLDEKEKDWMRTRLAQDTCMHMHEY